MQDPVAGLNLGVFEYTTVAALREEGLSAADLSDSRARKLIREKSQVINTFTEQWFAPVVGAARVDGRESGIAMLPNTVNIVELNSLAALDRSLDEASDQGTVLAKGDYLVQRRWVELNRCGGPGGLYGSNLPYAPPRNPGLGTNFWSSRVRMDGVFGHLELVKPTRFESQVNGALTAGATSAVLDSVDGLKVRDVLVFGEAPDYQRAIVLTINTGTKTVTFPALDEAVPDDARARAWGQVPRAVEVACQILVYLDKCPPFEKGGTFRDVILSGVGTTFSVPLTGTATGSLKVDLMLAEFVAPPIPRLV